MLASSQHHSATGGGHISHPYLCQNSTFTLSRRGLGGTGTACQHPAVPISTWTFCSHPVLGAAYRHWGRGHQFHSQESLTSAHRVTKGTRPSECHLSAGGCGVLYQATGEGLGQYSEAQEELEFPAAHPYLPPQFWLWLSPHLVLSMIWGLPAQRATSSRLTTCPYLSLLHPRATVLLAQVRVSGMYLKPSHQPVQVSNTARPAFVPFPQAPVWRREYSSAFSWDEPHWTQWEKR